MFCTQQRLCCFSWTKKHANKMINVIDGGNYYWCLMFCFQAVYSRLCGKAYYAAIKLYHFYQFLIFYLQLDAACAPYCKVKIKSLPCSTERALAGAHLHLLGLEPVGGELLSVTRGQCDAIPTVTFQATRHDRPLAGTIPNYTAW